MKKNKTLIIIIMIINLLIIGLILFVMLSADKTAPVFSFSSNETVYTDNMDRAYLYEGISAQDDREGDVSSRIVIEKIVKDEDAGRVTVTYAVSDSKGNVAKSSRIFPASFAGSQSVTEEAQETEEADAAQTPEEAAPEEVSSEEAPANAETDSSQSDSSQAIDIETIKSELKSELHDEIKQELETELKDEITKQQSSQPAVQSTPAAQTQTSAESSTPQTASNGGKPSIILQATTIKTPVGVAPAWIDIVTGITDDKDSFETLFKTLKYTNYNRNEKGSHTVQLTATDSDGNVSNPVTVNVVVQ